MLWQTEHRPWPLPSSPWVMAMKWHELLFIHWRVPHEAIRSIVPPGLALDTFDGSAWIGVVPFRMTGVRPRLAPPLPWLSAFPEINVRTYVTADSKPGVYFFSLDVPRILAVLGARLTYHLPYYLAEMVFSPIGDSIRYVSRRLRRSSPAADFVGRYRPTGTSFIAQRGTLDYFLTERYCLYSNDRHGHVYRAEIHHPLWALQPAELEIETNTMTQPLAIQLPTAPPLLHYAHFQRVVAWAPERVLR